MGTQYFGWDIGGAHLKVARLAGDGTVMAVRQVACPLWHGLEELSRACPALGFPLDDDDAVHAVTMTGELCDVFTDRADGVRRILAALAPQLASGATVRVYGGYDGWLSVDQAGGDYARSVASANWLALAAFTAEFVGEGVLIDIGSTTTDVIPIVGGEVRASGRDDATRLACDELVYTGVVRTPVMAVCDAVPFRGHWQPLAAEVFATTGDVYRVRGELAEQDDLMPTADGRGKDPESSARRLARMLGCDEGAEVLGAMGGVADWVASRQRERIARAVALIRSRLPGALAGAPYVGAGVGRFVVAALARAAGAPYRGFDEVLGVDGSLADDVATAAPALAVAKLAWMTD